MNYNIDFVAEHIRAINTGEAWCFVSDTEISKENQTRILSELEKYFLYWQAHGQKVTGHAQILFNRIVLVATDHKNAATVSGCSKDDMFKQIEGIEKAFNLNLFHRTAVGIMNLSDSSVIWIELSEIDDALEKGIVSSESIIINTAIWKIDQLKNDFLLKVADSWLKRFIPQVSN